MAKKMLNDIVKVQGGFVRAVRLKDDFFDEGLNKRKLESYLINPSATKMFCTIAKGLHPTSPKRTHLISGTYGSGKSHFGLVLANYVVRNSGDKKMEMTFRRLRQKDSSKASETYNYRNMDRPYLIVLLEGYDSDGIDHALLKGLREALLDPKRGGLQEEILETPYQEALNKIEEWEKERPEFHTKLSALLSSKEEDIDTLKNGLRGFKHKDYAMFKSLHQQVTTSPFVSHFGENAADIYEKTCRELISKHGFKGVVVIWDEFYAHLLHTDTALLGREQEALRRFAEKCERSGEGQIHLVLISHHLLHTYVRERISKESFDGWMTVEGRFEQHALTAIEEAEEVIELALTKEEGDREWQEVQKLLKIRTNLLDHAQNLALWPGKDRDWLWEKVCKGGYPLHPATVYCLPVVSDVVGQEYRTMFTFFEEETNSGGLTRYINETPLVTEEGELNLYTVDILFDFFQQAIENTPETKDIILKYAEAANKLADKSAPLTTRLLKTVAILETIRVKKITGLTATLPNLSWMLCTDEQELQSLIDSLEQSEILWKSSNEEYLFRSGRVRSDLGKDFNSARSSISWVNPFSKLREKYHRDDIVARKYKEQFKLTRRLKCEYISVGDLDNVAQYQRRIRGNYWDGIVLYVVTEQDSDIKEARKRAINITDSQIVIAIPKERIEIFETLKNIEALEILSDRQPYNLIGSEEHKMCQEKLTAEKRKIEEKLKKWHKVSNLEWFWKGKTLNIGQLQEDEIASLVMFDVFPKTPVVEHERMADRWTQDQKGDRLKLNTMILDKKSGPIRCEKKGNPPEKTILKQTFEPPGMLKFVKSEGAFDYFELTEPIKDAAREIWSLLKSGLMKKEVQSEFTDTVQKCQFPPFGVSPRVVELFLAAFLRQYRDQFAVFTKRTKNAEWEKRDFEGSTIYDIVNEKDYGKVLVQYRELPPLAEDYLTKVWALVSPDKEWDSKLSPVDGIGALFVEWLESLPLVTRKDKDLPKRTRIFLDSLVDIDRNCDMREVLFERLPRAAGTEKSLGEWDAKDLEQFEKDLKEIMDELCQHLDSVVRQAAGIFKKVFEVKGDTEWDVMETIKHWYNELSPAVKEHKFVGDPRILLKYSNISKDQFRERFLVDCAKEMGVKEYTKWEDKERTLQDYEKKLRTAKSEIEKVQAEKSRKPKPDSGRKVSQKAVSLKKALHNAISIARDGLGRDEIIKVLQEVIEELRK
jgi:hypothetical protein